MRFRRPLQQYRRLPEADAEKRAFHGVLFRLLVGALVNRYCSITRPPPPPPYRSLESSSYKDALFQLTALENPSRDVEAIELPTLLVERYEQEHYPIPAADPGSVVRFLNERQNLTQCDLIPPV